MADYYLGEIRAFSFDKVPTGWARCEGQVLPIAGNSALFSLLGILYGGDGRNTFALPDLRGRVIVGTGVTAHGSRYDKGNQGGAETVALTASNAPPHAHEVLGYSAVGGSAKPANGFPASMSNDNLPMPTPRPRYVAPQNLTHLDPATVSVSAGGAPHNNMQPFGAVAYCIAISGGIFPN